MPAIATSRMHPDSLDPVFRSIVTERYNQGPDLIPLFFGTFDSDRNQEKFSSITGLGDFEEFTGLISYDAPEQGYDITVVHKEWAKGLQLERKLLDDEQHGVIKESFSNFGDVARQTRQKTAAQWFNNMFILDSDYYTHTENVPLCSNSHTTPRTGVSTTTGFDNLQTSAFSLTALAADRYVMRKLKKFNGEYTDLSPNMLIVPVEKEDEALSMIRTKSGYDTAASDVNVQAGRYEVVSTVQLTSTANWAVVNKEEMKKNLKWCDRIPFEIDKMEHFDSYTFKGRAYYRCSYYHQFYQWIIGHQVS